MLCCHSNATRAPIANLPNSAQLGGSLYHSPKLHPGSCSSVGVRPWTDRQTHRQTDTQTRVTTIHFASSTTHARCNNDIFLFSFLFLLLIIILQCSTCSARCTSVCSQCLFVDLRQIKILYMAIYKCKNGKANWQNNGDMWRLALSVSALLQFFCNENLAIHKYGPQCANTEALWAHSQVEPRDNCCLPVSPVSYDTKLIHRKR